MKRILILLLCTALVSPTLTSCRKNEEKKNESSQLYTMEEDYKPIVPPENGWTIETIAHTIRLCGESIELPFTVGSLGKEFKFMDNVEEEIQNTRRVTYSDHEAFIASFVKSENNDDLYSKTVRKIASNEYYSDKDFQNCFIINGVGIGTSKEDVILLLGEPDSITETAYEYYSNHIKSEKYLIRFSFGDLNIVQSMFVNLIDE